MTNTGTGGSSPQPSDPSVGGGGVGTLETAPFTNVCYQGTTVEVAPSEAAVTLAEAKSHLNVYHDEEDTLIEAKVAAAQAWAERGTGRLFVTQTIKQVTTRFPANRRWTLPYELLQSVASVKYYDRDNVFQTLDSSFYIVDIDNEPGGLYIAAGQSWPTLGEARHDLVQVRFVVGYGLAADIPADLKAAVLFMTGHFYAQRENATYTGAVAKNVPDGAAALLVPFQANWM